MEIITDTLSEAHEAAIDVIVAQHKEIDIQTHVDKKEFTLEFEAEDGGDAIITLRILHPMRELQVSGGAPFQEGFTKAYKKQFLTLTPPRADGKHAVYTYFNRMKDFQMMNCLTGMYTCGGGNGEGFDQIELLVKKLARDPNSRRGVIVTWNPMLDAESIEPPCMDMLQVVIRRGKVNLRVVFRSQDILLGLPENLVGCFAFHEYITKRISEEAKTTYHVGELTLVSLIPHIYKKRDSTDLDTMLDYIRKKKAAGVWHPIIR